MVWGAIFADGKREVKLCEMTVDTQYYQNILIESLPFTYTTRFQFHQDGATCHTAKSTMEFLVQKNNICVLHEWPDLSIIENVWQVLKGRG